MRSKFIVLSHYSNEAIGEFDTVGVLPGVYESLEDAKAAADAALAEDLSNGIDHGEDVRVNESTCVLPFDLAPAYVVGEAVDGYFAGHHNIYAVFAAVSCSHWPRAPIFGG